MPPLSFLVFQVPVNCLIEACGYTKGCGALQVIRIGSFDVVKGKSSWISGPNDAAKATTVEIMERICDRDGCRVSVFRLEPSKSEPRIKSRVGV